MDPCCSRDFDSDGNCDQHPAESEMVPLGFPRYKELPELPEASTVTEIDPKSKYLLVIKGNLPKQRAEQYAYDLQERLKSKGIENVAVLISDSLKIFKLDA